MNSSWGLLGRFQEDTSTSKTRQFLCGWVFLREGCYKSLREGFKSLNFLLLKALNRFFSTRPTIGAASWCQCEVFAKWVASRRILPRLTSTEFRSPNGLFTLLLRLDNLITQLWKRQSKDHMLLSSSHRVIHTSESIGLALEQLSVEDRS